MYTYIYTTRPSRAPFIIFDVNVPARAFMLI